MTIDDFQAILKGKWQQSSKEHQGMGIVVLAVIQNWVPGDIFWAFSGQGRS